MLRSMLVLLCAFVLSNACGGLLDTSSAFYLDQNNGSDLKNLKFRNYSIQHGLSQATVLAMYQDKKGFLWISTLEGLNRFDGYQFKAWRFESNDTTTLNHNVVYEMLEDESNLMWIATHDGLSAYDPTTENFTRYYNGSSSGSKNSLLSMLPADSSHLWLASERGLFLFDKSNKEFHSFDYTTESGISLTDKHVKDLVLDGEDRLWIATKSDGLFAFDTQSKTLTQFTQEKDNSNSLSTNELHKLMLDNQSRLWIGTTNEGLCVLNLKTHAFRQYKNDPSDSRSLSSDRILSLHQDNDGLIWVGTSDAGLNLYNPATSDFLVFQNNPLNPFALPDNVVRFISNDRGGNLLTGHSSGGFCIADKSTQTFKHIKSSPLNNELLSHDNIWHILEDFQKNIWIATSNGLNVYDSNSKRNRVFQHEPGNSNSISQNYVRYVFEDKQQRIWIGTYGGVNVWYPKTSQMKRFSTIPGDETSLSDNKVRCIFQDNDGIIWVATAEGGLNRFDEEKQQFKSYMNDPTNPNSISGNSLRSIKEDKNGILWLGTDQGLNRFDKNSEVFKSYKYTAGDSLSISNNSIQYLYLSNDNFWVCTNGGLNSFDPETEEFRSWGIKQGMSNEIVYGILEDDDGFLWMSTNKGVNKFDVTNEQFTWYDELDGLQSNEFNAGAFMKDSQGMLYFGGVNGVSIFNPKMITPNEYIPPVVMTDFLLFNQSMKIAEDGVLKSAISSSDQIELGYKDYIWAIEFSALNFRQPEKNQFAYKLHPFNKDWIETSYRDRKAVFTNVPPGEYEFIVKASNDDGKWNDAGVSVSIVIHPPWWLLWWMKVLYVLIFVSGMLLIYKYRTRRLKIQKKVLKRMVNERTQEIEQKRAELKRKNEELGEKNEALSNALNDLASTQQKLIQSEKMASIGVLSSGVAHEINNPLNFIHGGISGLAHELEESEIADKKRFEVFIDAIKQGVSRAAKIIKSLNQFSHEGGSNHDVIEINDVIDNCLAILRNSLGDRVEIKRNFSEVGLSILGSRSKCHQIIINVLNNANQALGKGGAIEISTEKRGDSVWLTIEDNGCGISDENLKKVADPFFTTKTQGQGTGLGLFISYNLIKEMEGTLEIFSTEGKGTKVQISFPGARISELSQNVKVL